MLKARALVLVAALTLGLTVAGCVQMILLQPNPRSARVEAQASESDDAAPARSPGLRLLRRRGK